MLSKVGSTGEDGAMWLRWVAFVAVVAMMLALLPRVALAEPSAPQPWADEVPYRPPHPDVPVPASLPSSEPGERLPFGWVPRSDVVVRYERPSTGEVLRGFERPTAAFGEGHRGVDLALAPGAPITSAASGFVHHAGPVGDTVWVSVGHADGILTSYGPMNHLEVRRGDLVARGQRLGRLASGGHGHDGRDRGLHWGARRGLEYLDPLTLLDPGTPRPSLVGSGSWTGTAHVVVPYEPWAGERWGGLRLSPSPAAEGAGFAVPPSPNHLVMVAGLGSNSNHVPIDPHHLGYPDRSVTLFSYSGRHDPEILDPEDPRRDQLPYDHRDTWPGVEVAAERLAEQLRAQRRREPGRGVDLIGHSLGGMVILYYLTHLHDPYDITLPTIGRVVTVGAPHQGSHVAGSARWIRAHPVLGGGVEAVRGMISVGGGITARDQVALDAPSLDQVASGSGFLRGYGQAWSDALAAGHGGPLAMGTEVLAIAGATDVAVSSGSAWLPDDSDVIPRVDAHAGRTGGFLASDVNVNTVLPGGHTGVLETEAVREAAWRFLAGDEVTTAGRPVAGALTDEIGLAIQVGAVAAYAYGGVLGGLRRIARTPHHGPIEVTDDLDEVVRSPARWTDDDDNG
jgi:hypothetical protein